MNKQKINSLRVVIGKGLYEAEQLKPSEESIAQTDPMQVIHRYGEVISKLEKTLITLDGQLVNQRLLL